MSDNRKAAGVVSVVAFCATCGWEYQGQARAVPGMHARTHNHRVHGHITKAFAYGRKHSSGKGEKG